MPDDDIVAAIRDVVANSRAVLVANTTVNVVASAPVVANLDGVVVATNEIATTAYEQVATNPIFTVGNEITGRLSQWRIERNSNNYYRWRWQKKTASGKPVTYQTGSGKTGYRRGSKYLPRVQAIGALDGNKN